MKHVLWLIMMVYLITACAPPPAAAPVTPTLEQKGAEPGGVDLKEAYILYERSGGFAGEIVSWTIYPDGRAVSRTGEELQLDPASVARLFEEAGSLGFFELKESYNPSNTCNDCYNYSLTIHNGQRQKTVGVVEDGSGSPRSFWTLLEQVDSLTGTR